MSFDASQPHWQIESNQIRFAKIRGLNQRFLKFIGSNFSDSKFVGCNFDYTNFERTIITGEILDNCCPSYENLKLKFARTLRMNFQQIGDSELANKAIGIELEATEIHRRKAAFSNEPYYRKKYRDFDRFKAFIDWLKFKLLDIIWGNGESLYKLIRSIVSIFIAMFILDIYIFADPINSNNFIYSLAKIPEIFLGVVTPDHYPKLYLVSIVFVRLVTMGFFMSIIIKRFNRR